MTPPPVSGAGRRRSALRQRLLGYLPDLASFAAALLAAALGALLLAAMPGCGGGSGVGGEGTGSFASGTISGFGSIIVNGVHYDERSAQRLDDDGNALASDDLALGMVVEVSAGAISSDASGVQAAVAQSVRTRRALVGPLDAAPDLAGGRLSLLGQTVLVSDETVVDARLGGGLAGLAAGQRLEVYGFYDASAGAFRATRIAPAGGTANRVTGPVASVDAAGGRVTLGGQSYALAAGASLGGLSAGSQVRLELRAADGGRWEVQARDDDDSSAPADRDGAGLEGVVGSVLSATRFVVGSVVVDSASAQVSGTVQVGARVQVAGVLRSGVLVASQVSVRGSGVRSFELSGTVDSLDLPGLSLVLRGVRISLARSDLRVDGGTLAQLQAGQRLRVEGVLSADRTVLEATRLRFAD